MSEDYLKLIDELVRKQNRGEDATEVVAKLQKWLKEESDRILEQFKQQGKLPEAKP